MPRTPYRNTYGEGGGIRTHDLNLIRRETGRIRDSNPGPQGDKEVLLPTELPPLPWCHPSPAGCPAASVRASLCRSARVYVGIGTDRVNTPHASATRRASAMGYTRMHATARPPPALAPTIMLPMPGFSMPRLNTLATMSARASAAWRRTHPCHRIHAWRNTHTHTHTQTHTRTHTHTHTHTQSWIE